MSNHARELPRLVTQRIESAPRRRHDGRVGKVSRDPALLRRLDRLTVDEAGVELAVAEVCRSFRIAQPRLRFHARRSPFTGAAERPRASWVALLGEAEVRRREVNGWGQLPASGALRFGRTTTLMTVAHELAHLVVFSIDPPDTAAHGHRWIERFDDAAVVLDGLVSS